METIKIYSPVNDKDIRKNLADSPMWKEAYHEEDFSEAKAKHGELYEYSIKFENTKPIQVTNVKRM